MNILIVTNPYTSLRSVGHNDVEAHIVQLANEFVMQQHTVEVIAKDADERNPFRVIEFHESPLSMKDTSFRACSESLGQRHFIALQLGTIDVRRYDRVLYFATVPEIYEVAALINHQSVLCIASPYSERLRTVYTLYMNQSNSHAIAVNQNVYDEWKPYISNLLLLGQHENKSLADEYLSLTTRSERYA